MTQQDHGTVVVHLVWEGAGLSALRRFVESYLRFDAGAPHDLVFGLKGFPEPLPDEYTRCLAKVPHKVIEVPNVGKDIAAYRFLVDALAPDYDNVLLLNSSSEFLAANWLKYYLLARGDAETRVIGATGSYEPIPTSPTFPNPHLRTNALFADIGFLQSLDWRESMDGAQFEAGPSSLVRQVERAGGSHAVVDRTGRAYSAERWRESRTFRCGGQSGLLVADNRTRAYSEADEAMRLWLFLQAWTNEPPGKRPKPSSRRHLIASAISPRRRRQRRKYLGEV